MVSAEPQRRQFIVDAPKGRSDGQQVNIEPQASPSITAQRALLRGIPHKLCASRFNVAKPIKNKPLSVHTFQKTAIYNSRLISRYELVTCLHRVSSYLTNPHSPLT